MIDCVPSSDPLGLWFHQVGPFVTVLSLVSVYGLGVLLGFPIFRMIDWIMGFDTSRESGQS